MSSRRGLALSVLLVLVHVATNVPGRHVHEAWEEDLAPHAHVGEAVMVAAAEDCGGATHLHPVEAREHEACPACLTACGRVATPGHHRAAAPDVAPSAAIGATAPMVPGSASRCSTGSRAPPRI